MEMETMTDPVGIIQDAQSFAIGREAVITISPMRGMVCVTTTRYKELNGMTCWRHRGDETLVQFLISSKVDYVIGTLFDRQALKEFDVDATIAGIKAWIIDRRCAWFDGPSREKAREWWDEAGDICEVGEMQDLDWLGDSWYEFIVQRDTPAVRYFTECIWGPFIEHLKVLEAARVAVI
jgi:hypothetical protein